MGIRWWYWVDTIFLSRAVERDLNFISRSKKELQQVNGQIKVSIKLQMSIKKMKTLLKKSISLCGLNHWTLTKGLFYDQNLMNPQTHIILKTTPGNFRS
jgi:hypothetical protein